MTGLPRTYLSVTGAGIAQDRVFDPALKQYPSAYRAGEPQFTDVREGRRWREARRAALEQLVRAVAASLWSDRLVLRGSMLLKAWYGEAAREPGDLDFVVTPSTWMLDDSETAEMFAGIARAAEHGEVAIDAAAAVTDDIWTYERVPGRRLVLPWHADGLPSGSVQLDFTFNETLPLPPEPTRVAGAEVQAATPALSLAWKLQWLLNDLYPQAKDLYDAVLLAGHARVSHRLFRELAVAADPFYARNPLSLDGFSLDKVDWSGFQVPVDRRSLVDEVTAVLTEILAEPLPEPDSEYERRALWLAPRIADCRTVLADAGEDAALHWLGEQNLLFEDQALIVREAIGCSLREAASKMLALLQSWNDSFVRRADQLLARIEVFEPDSHP